MNADAATEHAARRMDRIGPMDLTIVAADRGSVPMNIGAILEFDAPGGPSLASVEELLSARVPTIPRLRQRLRRVPIGCGRAVWVDDPDFRLDRHLIHREWPPPGGDRELLDVAAELLCQRLPTDRPLWLACLLADPVGRRTALVLVLHHVLADGLGGLAILAALADPGIQVPSRAFPQPPPPRSEMAVDAARGKIRAAATLPARLRRSRAGLRELGLGPTRPHLVEKTSLNRPTSNRRRLAAVTAPLADIVAAAHRAGGTVNDVVLAAVTGALIGELHARGEHPSRLVVSVPVSGRHPRPQTSSATTPGSDRSPSPHSSTTTPDSPRSSPSPGQALNWHGPPQRARSDWRSESSAGSGCSSPSSTTSGSCIPSRPTCEVPSHRCRSAGTRWPPWSPQP